MRSFTFIETLVTIFVFSLIITVVFASITAVYQTHSYVWQQSVAIEEAQRGVKIMAKEIREAKTGDNGSYPIEKAGDKEFIFYSDIDKDGDIEKIRYFLGSISSGSQSKDCVSFLKGGTCETNFSGFFQGTLKSAYLTVSAEGDLGLSNERVEIYADGVHLGTVCQTGCVDCLGSWQGDAVYDVTQYAQDNSLQFLADATSQVDPICDWINPNHSIKVKFDISWEEENTQNGHQFKKGVINPASSPIQYPPENEEISIISEYVRNAPPIFEYFYFDENQNQFVKIEDYPAKLLDTKLMKVFLVVNVDPNRPPDDFELESYVQLRNLKESD